MNGQMEHTGKVPVLVLVRMPQWCLVNFVIVACVCQQPTTIFFRLTSSMERERNDPVSPPSLPIPSSYLVLHKLKQWDECQTRAHNNPGSNHVQTLHTVRAELFNMLKNLRYSIPKFHHDQTYDPNLHNESAPRVVRFLAAYGCYGKEWRKMGFEGSARPGGGLARPSEGSSRPNEGSAQPSENLPRQRKLSVMQIRSLAARTTVAILANVGLPCAIFGSMACKLYGNHRIPNVRFFSLSSKGTLITL